MGATDAITSYDKITDRKKTAKDFERFTAGQRCDIRGEGNSYCGCICQKTTIGYWASEPFASYSEAQNWVLRKSGKWDDSAAAASYYVAAPITEAQKARRTKLNAEVNAKREELDGRIRTQLNKLREAKSKTVTCSGCSSRLSRKHLTNGILRAAQLPTELRVAGAGESQAGRCGCPLCGAPLLSTSALKAIAVGRKRLQAARKKAEVASKRKVTKKVKWIVGGMVSE